MKITNIEVNNTNYNNISDLFSAFITMTLDNRYIIDGVRAAYSDDNPDQNAVHYPDGFHFKDEIEQTLINEQVLSALAKRAQEHDRKKLHDAVKKIMTCTNNKK